MNVHKPHAVLRRALRERSLEDYLQMIQPVLDSLGGLPIVGPCSVRMAPLAGEIDHDALSREHMARYPKIRARLAE